MRFGYVLPLALVLVGMFIFGCQDGAQSAGPTFAVVDMGRIFRDSAPGKDCAKYLESRQKDLQGQMDALQDKLEKNPNDEKAMQELQRVYAVSQQRLQAEQQNVVNILYDTIQRVLNEYRASKGYSAIFTTEGTAVFDPKIDVTTDVIAQVDKQKVDLSAIAAKEDAAKAAPAAETGKAPAATEQPATDKADDSAKTDDSATQKKDDASAPRKDEATDQTGAKDANKDAGKDASRNKK